MPNEKMTKPHEVLAGVDHGEALAYATAIQNIGVSDVCPVSAAQSLAKAYIAQAAELALLKKVAEAALKLQEHWQAEGYGRYACAGEADFLEALTKYREREGVKV